MIEALADGISIAAVKRTNKIVFVRIIVLLFKTGSLLVLSGFFIFERDLARSSALFLMEGRT